MARKRFGNYIEVERMFRRVSFALAVCANARQSADML
jgi:hypothetical protein